MLALISVFSLLLTGCNGSDSSNNRLIGKWEHKEPVSGITVTVEFTKDKLSFSAEGVASAATTYKYVDEDTIMVRSPDTGADVETSYAINGDTLTITFSGETQVEFTRVK
jgi:uncharacterized alpha/beta hydrolase family protein